MTELDRLQMKLDASRSMQNSGGSGFKDRIAEIEKQIEREKAKDEGEENAV